MSSPAAPAPSPGHRARRALAAGASVLVAAISWLSSPPPAAAACASPPDPVAAMTMADVVFVGSVAEVSDLGRVATMDVLEIWKGPDIGTPVVVNGSFSGGDVVGSNDRTYQLGQTYLVVPFGTRAPFFDEVCSATRTFTPSGGTIPGPYQQAVGAVTARVPTPSAAAEPGGGGSTGPLVVGGVAGLCALMALVVWRMRRKQKPTRVKLGTAPPEVARPAAREESLPRPKPSRAARKKQRADKKAAKKAAKLAGKKAEAPGIDPGKRRGRSRRETVAGEVASSGRRSRRERRDKKAKAGRSRSARAPSVRFSRSGISNLEAMRKKTRRVKGRKKG